MKGSTVILKLIKNKTLLIMLLPATLYVIIFSYIPMGGIILAFKNYNYKGGIFGSEWVGFDNFKYLIISDKLWPLTVHTVLYNLVFILSGVVVEVVFAIFLSEITKHAFKKISQGLMFLPFFISWVVVSAIMLNLFGFEKGAFNHVLMFIGLDPINIYANAQTWPIVLVMVKLWKATGYGSVIYLAAIMGISNELFEAANIDGANIFQKIRYITLPSIKPTIIILILFGIGNVFRGDFGLFYQIVGNNAVLLKTSDILDTFVYRSLMSSPNLGMTAAAGLYQSVMCFVTIITVNFIIKKIEPDYALF